MWPGVYMPPNWAPRNKEANSKKRCKREIDPRERMKSKMAVSSDTFSLNLTTTPKFYGYTESVAILSWPEECLPLSIEYRIGLTQECIADSHVWLPLAAVTSTPARSDNERCVTASGRRAGYCAKSEARRTTDMMTGVVERSWWSYDEDWIRLLLTIPVILYCADWLNGLISVANDVKRWMEYETGTVELGYMRCCVPVIVNVYKWTQ